LGLFWRIGFWGLVGQPVVGRLIISVAVLVTVAAAAAVAWLNT